MTDTMTAPAYSVSDNAIQVWVENHPDGQADSVVDLGWCTSPALMEELVQKQAVDPQLLLVITHDGYETGRYLVPIGSKKWQVRFRRSGLNRVFAVAVWSEKNPDYSAEKLLMKKNKNGFVVDLITKGDAELDRLLGEYRALKATLEDKTYTLQMENYKLEELEIEAPPEGASAEELQAFELRQRIEQLEHELAVVEGTYTEPKPADMALIASLEAELPLLEQEVQARKAAWKAREASPVYEASLQSSFSLAVDYHHNYAIRSENIGMLDVEVPALMFAREPGKAIKWLGNRYNWPRPAVDQCHLRQRALFTLATIWPRALAIAVVGIVAELVTLIVIGALSLAGMRNINFKVIQHPVSEFGEFFTDKYHKSSIWFRKLGDDGRLKDRSPVFWVFNPLSFVIMLGIGAFIWLLSNNIIFLYIGAGSVVGLPLLMLALSAVVRGPLEGARQGFRNWIDKRVDVAYQRALVETKHELAEITCGTTLPQPTGILAALPRHRRVAYIAYNAKARVCKPFEG